MSTKVIELNSGELTMLRRALRMYAKQYQEMKLQSKEQWEKDDLQGYIDASDRLGARLIHDLKPKGE